jgi:hypothetical protein
METIDGKARIRIYACKLDEKWRTRFLRYSISHHASKTIGGRCMVKAFRFGVVSAGNASSSAWITLAQRVEELGYASLLMPDRTITPLAALTALAVAPISSNWACLLTRLAPASLALRRRCPSSKRSLPPKPSISPATPIPSRTCVVSQDRCSSPILPSLSVAQGVGCSLLRHARPTSLPRHSNEVRRDLIRQMPH